MSIAHIAEVRKVYARLNDLWSLREGPVQQTPCPTPRYHNPEGMSQKTVACRPAKVGYGK